MFLAIAGIICVAILPGGTCVITAGILLIIGFAVLFISLFGKQKKI